MAEKDFDIWYGRKSMNKEAPGCRPARWVDPEAGDIPTEVLHCRWKYGQMMEEAH